MSPTVQTPPMTQSFLGQDGKPVQVWKDWFLRTTTQLTVGTAPSDGPYLTTTAHADLTAAVNLALLPDGYLHIRTALGVATVVSAFAVTTQASPADPPGTASAAGVMMGLAVTMTPRVTGRIQVIITGTIANATAIADGATVQLRTGTGAAPANGDALTGTAAGGLVQYIAATVLEKAPFTVSAIISGLTLGVMTWMDLGVAAVTGGTATVTDLSVSAVEL